MSVLEIQERLRKAHSDPLTFRQHAESDMRYLLHLLDEVARLEFPEPRREAFRTQDVYTDEQGHLCLRTKKRAN